MRDAPCGGRCPARSWLLALVLVCALDPPPASALCSSPRKFVSNASYLQDSYPYPGQFTGAFWALGAGSPQAGTGIDQGTTELCDWAFTGGGYPGQYCIVYPYYLGIAGDWAELTVDGCVDDAGATAELDGDECMVLAFSDREGRFEPVAGWIPTAAVLSDRAEPGAHPDPDVAFDFAVPHGVIEFTPILKPTVLSAVPAGAQVDLNLRAPPDLAGGRYLDPTCDGDVVLGVRVMVRDAVPGSEAPRFGALDVASGWTDVTGVVPFDEVTPVTLSCNATHDTDLAAVLALDSAFNTTVVSRTGRRISTATDSDGDGIADACDTCTDTDGDGFGGRTLPAAECPLDNCADTFNPRQRDADGDGAGDACDACPGSADPLSVQLLNEANTDDLLRRFELAPDGSRLVYLAHLESPGAQLYSVATGGGTPVRLNDELPAAGSVSSFRVTPDGTRVAYTADQDLQGRQEAYSVPVAGGVTSRLNGPLQPRGSAAVAAVTPDGTTVILRADGLLGGNGELYAVPVDGSLPPTRLAVPSVAGWKLFAAAVSPDGGRLVYRADADTPGKSELYSVRLSGGAVTKLNTGIHDRIMLTPLITADSQRVVFMNEFELYGVPIGGGVPVKLSPPLGDTFSQVQFDFAVNGPGGAGGDAARAVFRADPDVYERRNLYSIHPDGGPLTQLNPALAAGQTVSDFAVSPDGMRVVYRANLDDPGVFELYSVPIDGGSPIKLNGPLVTGGQVIGTTHQGFSNLSARDGAFEITPDGSAVVYRADQDVDQRFELYRAPIDGGEVLRLGGVPGGGSLLSFELSPDGSTAVFRGIDPDDLQYHLYAVSLQGGPVLKVSQPAVRAPPTPQGVLPRVDQIYRFARQGSTVSYRAPEGLFATPTRCEACGDFDGDGLCAEEDNCPFVAGAGQGDADGDGAGDACDPCTDTDGDGAGDPGFAAGACVHDNCPALSNPDQADADADGAGDACDCAPADPLRRRPGPVTGVLADKVAGGLRLTWVVPAGADTSAVTRGRLADLSVEGYGPCAAEGLPAPEHQDAETPDVGEGYGYLIQGVSASCGAGSLGVTSHAGQRVNAAPQACP